MATSRVAITERGLRIDGEDHILISGEVHPWRIDPANWERVLDAMASIGVGFVSTYIPWSVHEVAPGKYDFTGSRDIVRFLRLAEDRGLKALVRPGPDCASELPDSGWPRRILEDDRCWARRPGGEPYLLVTATSHLLAPSYASKVFLEAAAEWFRGFSDAVAPLQYPEGPVIACQIDNEIGYHFQPNTFALDYHPESISGYRKFLAGTYGDIAELNRTYGTRHRSFEDVEPPTDGTDEPEVRRTDWVEWREVHLRQALTTLAVSMRKSGMDQIPLIHNDYPRMATPLDPAAIEAETGIDLSAGDIYTTKEGGSWMREFVRFVAGTSLYPTLLELGAGWLTLPWLFPARVTVSDQEIVSLRAVLGGIRGVNVYMMVERDRWYGSPVSVKGESRTDSASMFSKLFKFMRESGIAEMTRQAKVLLLENRTEARRAAARETLGDMSPPATPLFPVDRRLFEMPNPDTEELRTWETELSRVLNDAGVDFDRAVSTSVEGIDRYELVVMPSLDAMDRRTWEALQKAGSSATTVVVGPRIPTLDERLRETAFETHGIEVIEKADDLGKFLPTPSFARGPKEVDLNIWEGSQSGGILAAFNSSGDKVTAHINFEGSLKFEGIWQQEALEAEDSLETELGPWDTKVWRFKR